MISNLQLPNSEEFDVDTTLTLTRRQTKETLALWITGQKAAPKLAEGV